MNIFPIFKKLYDEMLINYLAHKVDEFFHDDQQIEMAIRLLLGAEIVRNEYQNIKNITKSQTSLEKEQVSGLEIATQGEAINLERLQDIFVDMFLRELKLNADRHKGKPSKFMKDVTKLIANESIYSNPILIDGIKRKLAVTEDINLIEQKKLAEIIMKKLPYYNPDPLTSDLLKKADIGKCYDSILQNIQSSAIDKKHKEKIIKYLGKNKIQFDELLRENAAVLQQAKEMAKAEANDNSKTIKLSTALPPIIDNLEAPVSTRHPHGGKSPYTRIKS